MQKNDKYIKAQNDFEAQKRLIARISAHILGRSQCGKSPGETYLMLPRFGHREAFLILRSIN